MSIFRAGGAIDRLRGRADTVEAWQRELTERTASEAARGDAHAAELDRLADWIAALEALVAEQSATIERQADRLATLEEEAERQALWSAQAGADIARIDLQAKIDLAESRETNAAFAALVLKPRSRQPVESGEEGTA